MKKSTTSTETIPVKADDFLRKLGIRDKGEFTAYMVMGTTYVTFETTVGGKKKRTDYRFSTKEISRKLGLRKDLHDISGTQYGIEIEVRA